MYTNLSSCFEDSCHVGDDLSRDAQLFGPLDRFFAGRQETPATLPQSTDGKSAGSAALPVLCCLFYVEWRVAIL